MQYVDFDTKLNLIETQQKIKLACDRAGRGLDEVELMAVSKSQDIKKAFELLQYGVKLFGENRVQELKDKHPVFHLNNAQCHFIGKLQKNKVKYLPALTNFIQSVDSIALAKEIDKQYAKHNKIANILIQVNVGNERTKSGVGTKEVLGLAAEICQTFENVRLKGLMCIPPPLRGDGTQLRRDFSTMRSIFEELQNKSMNGAEISVLSMGMSADFDIAIEEGATLIRVGSALFGKRNYNA